MSAEVVVKPSVRFGRVPKREKAKILAAMQSVNARSQEKALAAELEDEARLVATVVRAHEETCDYTRDKIGAVFQRARENPVYTLCPPHLSCPLNPHPKPLNNGNGRLLEDFSERFSPTIRGVVEFAKRIPGFSLLQTDDQVQLLKGGVFEVLLVRLACMFDSRANTMVCLNGQLLRRDSINHTSHARFLMDSMFDFSERVNQLRLLDSELGLFCAIVVIAADRPGLRNTELVEKIQSKLMQALQNTVSQNHPENPSLFQELVKKIPDLRTLNTLHSEKLLAFKMEPRGGEGGNPDGTAANNPHKQQHTMASATAAAVGQAFLPNYTHSLPPPWSEYAAVAAAAGNHLEDRLINGRQLLADSDSPRPYDDDLVVKSPCGSVSSAVSGCSGEVSRITAEYVQSQVCGHHGATQDVVEGGTSSDEGSVVDSPPNHAKCPFKIRKLESPTDSGIESGKELSGSGSHSRSTSICSSPRSSLEEKVKDVSDCESASERQESIEDMPVLKRALQAPPLINTSLLMDEAYKPHKKFRALRKDSADSTPTSPKAAPSPNMCPSMCPNMNAANNAASLASTHSTLVKTLEQGPRMSEQQLKRTDIIHNIIMRTEGGGRMAGAHGQQQPPNNPNNPHHRPAADICPVVPTSYATGTTTTANGPIYGSSSPNGKGIVVCATPPGFYGVSQQTMNTTSSSPYTSWQFVATNTNNGSVTVPSTRPMAAISARTPSPQQHHQQHHQSQHQQCPQRAASSYHYVDHRSPSAVSPSLVLSSPQTVSLSPPPPTTSFQNPRKSTPSPVVMGVCPQQQQEMGAPPPDSQQPLNLSKKGSTPPPPPIVSSPLQQQHVPLSHIGTSLLATALHSGSIAISHGGLIRPNSPKVVKMEPSFAFN